VKSSHTTHVVFQLANTYERCDIGTASIDRSSEGSGKSTGGVRAVAAAGAGAGSTATHAAAGGAEVVAFHKRQDACSHGGPCPLGPDKQLTHMSTGKLKICDMQRSLSSLHMCLLAVRSHMHAVCCEWCQSGKHCNVLVLFFATRCTDGGRAIDRRV